MEITYFALGMLSMVALTFVGIIVWGLFRVSKLERQIVDIKDDCKYSFESIHRRLDEDRTNQFREFGDYYKTTNDKFDKLEQFEIRRFDEILRIIEDKYVNSLRYTDKRIDKTINQKEVL